MRYLKLYAEICFVVGVCAVIVIGVAPYLISSDSSLEVIYGVALLLLIPPMLALFAYHVWKLHIKPLITKDSPNEKESSSRRRRPN